MDDRQRHLSCSDTSMNQIDIKCGSESECSGWLWQLAQLHPPTFDYLEYLYTVMKYVIVLDQVFVWEQSSFPCLPIKVKLISC